ncbi:peptidase inhibitor family I36 protein [Actinacidiphila glaucinigra]|uniref:peptidase inhibitor family I36 protein n=1 Tax=Actinacidiphila glaucinigra TaxID=235986 RepID=UPI0033EA4313
MRSAVLTLALTAAAAALAAPAPPVAAAPAAAGPAGRCDPGELCLWDRPGYRGARLVHELADTDVNSCVPLPPGASAKSFVNRTRKLVTTYQSAECSTEGDFVTFPSGTWVPESRHTVRAFQIVDQ